MSFGALPARPGTYALVLDLPKYETLRIGRLGYRPLEAGVYVYVGSAHGSGGLRARVGRHLEGGQHRHWHVDHLREVAEPRAVWFSVGTEELEHLWTAALAVRRGASQPVAGFGSSDCGCRSHLVRFSMMPSRRGFVRRLRRLAPEVPRVQQCLRGSRPING